MAMRRHKIGTSVWRGGWCPNLPWWIEVLELVRRDGWSVDRRPMTRSVAGTPWRGAPRRPLEVAKAQAFGLRFRVGAAGFEPAASAG
jgi:hypothetical protein